MRPPSGELRSFALLGNLLVSAVERISMSEQAVQRFAKVLKSKAVEKNFGKVIDINEVYSVSKSIGRRDLINDPETNEELGKWFIKEFDYLTAYHGTTGNIKQVIKRKGLRTRSESGVSSVDEGAVSHEDKVYFGLGVEGSFPRSRARNIASHFDGIPLLVEALLDTSRLYPDEDSFGMFPANEESRKYAVMSIICGTKSVAHVGSVNPPGGGGPSKIIGMEEFGPTYRSNEQLSMEEFIRLLDETEIS